MALRWRKNKRETGLQRVMAGPRGSVLCDGETKFASISVLHRGCQALGWYWVAGWNSGIPYFNSYKNTSPDETTAKDEAMAYVKKHRASIAAAPTGEQQ